MSNNRLKVANRTKVKLRIGISGASGFGKTYSALLMAYGITKDWSKIAVIDTENGSADLFDNLGKYNTLTLTAPFSPERYIEAIKECEDAGMELIIIDSISHEWEGKGGCLELAEQATVAMKTPNSYTAWGKVTPRHNAFIQSILQSKCHMITTARRKQDYDMSKDDRGKTVITKVGMKEITREGFEYELTLNFEIINDEHFVKPSKDRTCLFMNKPCFVITEQTGELLADWANKGADIIPIAKIEIDKCKTVEELTQLWRLNPSWQTFKEVVDMFGAKRKEVSVAVAEPQK